MRGVWAKLMLLALALPAAGQDMPLNQILLPGEDWEAVKGPWDEPVSLAGDAAGSVFVSDAATTTVYRIGNGEKVGTWARASAVTVGLCVDPKGVLLGCQPTAQRLVALGNVEAERVVQEKFEGQVLATGPNGTVFYSVPRKGFVGRVGGAGPLAEGLLTPGGLALWSDGGTLVVGEAGGKHLVAFRVDGDGRLSARERYYPLRVQGKEPSEAVGLVLDTAGRLYAATREGVQVFDPTGRLSGVLLRPERQPITALAFGGPDRQSLFVVCGSKVYIRKTKAQGLPPFKAG